MKNLSDLIGKLEKVVNVVAEEVGKSVIEHTPIDTTHAVKNWSVSVDKRSFDEVGKYPAAGDGYSYAYRSLNEATTIFDINRNSFISLDNNAPYIEALNNGHSETQAPDGILTDENINSGIRTAMKRLGF